MTTKMEKSNNAVDAAQSVQLVKLSQEFINWYTDPQRILHFGISQNNGSDLESDFEDNVSDTGSTNEPPAIQKYDPTIDDNLPPTVTLLTTPEGGKLYLVGTAHFSVESQNDVSKIIRAVQPNIVMMELCKNRMHALDFDEETLLKQSENISIEDIRTAIKKHGVASGLMFIVLLSMSRHVTRELGMAPGSEFRTAFVEAAKIPNCIVHLGDRPFNITIQRAFRTLSFWQKLKCGHKLFSSREPITKQDVENCKNPDKLDALLEELTAAFPPLAEVMVKERDLFLTYSLQLACQPQVTNEGVIVPTRAVGVIGIGHMPGIIKNWGKVTANDIQPIMKIPPRPLSSKIIKFTIKASFIGIVIYVGYKIIPLPSTQTLETIKSSVKGLLKISSTN